MKREIKFRGVDKSTKEWIVATGFLLFPDGSIVVGEYEQGNLVTSPIIPETLCQFTGLKDKNGKDIYEGDVYCCFERKYKIIFDNGAFCATSVEKHFPSPLNWKPESLDDCIVDDFCLKIEIIGNIHENPELLNG